MEKVIQHLLTENRFWTFWKNDWSEKVEVQWNQKTKFTDIVRQMKKRLGKDVMIERNIAPEKIDVTFD